MSKNPLKYKCPKCGAKVNLKWSHILGNSTRKCLCKEKISKRKIRILGANKMIEKLK